MAHCWFCHQEAGRCSLVSFLLFTVGNRSFFLGQPFLEMPLSMLEACLIYALGVP